MTSSVNYDVNSDKFPLNVTITNQDYDLIISDFKEVGFTDIIINEENNFYDEKLEIYITATKMR
jgi:hypothetical protein